jgi:beta-lactamase class D
MEEMRKHVDSPTFILMSDEPEFWKDLAGTIVVVDEKDPEVALYFMSQFKHYIIANSTFSWWASYLSPHADQGVVIAPKQWFGPSGHRDTVDVYRKGMILVDQL